MLSELPRLSDRPDLGAEALFPLLLRLELRPTEARLVLDHDGLFSADHPELAVEDLRIRLQPGERLVIARGSPPALRVALPVACSCPADAPGRLWAMVHRCGRASIQG